MLNESILWMPYFSCGCLIICDGKISRFISLLSCAQYMALCVSIFFNKNSIHLKKCHIFNLIVRWLLHKTVRNLHLDFISFYLWLLIGYFIYFITLIKKGKSLKRKKLYLKTYFVEYFLSNYNEYTIYIYIYESSL